MYGCSQRAASVAFHQICCKVLMKTLWFFTVHETPAWPHGAYHTTSSLGFQRLVITSENKKLVLILRYCVDTVSLCAIIPFFIHFVLCCMSGRINIKSRHFVHCFGGETRMELFGFKQFNCQELNLPEDQKAIYWFQSLSSFTFWKQEKKNYRNTRKIERNNGQVRPNQKGSEQSK